MKAQSKNTPPQTRTPDATATATASRLTSTAAAAADGSAEPLSRRVATSSEVPPRVVRNTGKSDGAPVQATSILKGNFPSNVRATSLLTGDVPTKIQATSIATGSQTSTGSVAAISSTPEVARTTFPSLTRAQFTPGDLVFKVGTERSNNTYQKIMQHQKDVIVPNYTSNHHLIPVDPHNVTHCDISVGDGLLAKVGGPRNKGEWISLGEQTPTHFLPVEKLKGYSDSFIVLRPNNRDVAKNISDTAKGVIEGGSNYSVPKLLISSLYPHDRGAEETPSLRGSEHGPQPKPLEIPTRMFCTEYVSNVVISSERELLREDREALEAESINRPRLSPAELVDTLAGSGNFTVYNVDLEEEEPR